MPKKSHFRIWWQLPKKISEREDERRVTFLELFYDLIYVVLIAELAHSLSQNINLTGIGAFTFIFLIVLVAWTNGTMYHELHGNNDIRTRIFTFLQMGTVASMAVFAHSVLGEGFTGFAFSFAAYQLILTFLWWRTGMHDEDHRPLSNPYSLTFLISTGIFCGSAFVPEQWRLYMWGLALFISLLIPVAIIGAGKNNPRVQEQLDMASDVKPSAVERFGLLTIIVLGEVLAGVVRGIAGLDHLTWLVGGTAVLSMLIAIGMWWIYFDFISQRMPKPGRATVYGWMYLHMPMTIGIVATGAAVLNVVEHSGEPLGQEVRWLLVGSVGATLVCIALLMRVIQMPAKFMKLYRRGGIMTLIFGLIIPLLGLTCLDSIPLLAIIIALLLTPVIYSVIVWIKIFGGEEIPIT